MFTREARSWSFYSRNPYEEDDRQTVEQAPRSPVYVPEDHIPVYIPEPEHPEDLVSAEDEAPIPPLITILFSSTGPTYCYPYLYLHHLTSRRVDYPKADMPPRRDPTYYSRLGCADWHELTVLETEDAVAPCLAASGSDDLSNSAYHGVPRPHGVLLSFDGLLQLAGELWNLKVKGTDVVAYNQRFQELALLSDRMFPEETDKIKRYVGHFKKDCPQWKNKNQGNGNGVAKAYAVGVAGQNPDNNVVTGSVSLNNLGFPVCLITDLIYSKDKRAEPRRASEIILELLKKGGVPRSNPLKIGHLYDTNGGFCQFLGIAAKLWFCAPDVNAKGKVVFALKIWKAISVFGTSWYGVIDHKRRADVVLML
ncbi:hypothetical protein Tco_0517636 [Tanacetum coccineum]